MQKVSVIIPYYNGGEFIKDTLESILNQTYRNYEIIVVDDGSTDGSTDNSKGVLDSFKDKIRYFYQANEGISGARNRAIKESKGEYIALLDQDDIWYPEKLEKQVEVMNQNLDAGIVYSDCYYVNKKGDILYRVFEKQRAYSGWIFKNLFIENFIPIPTVLIRKKILDEVGLFDKRYSFAEEYELFLRIARIYPVEYIDEPLAGYRIHDKNLSKNIEKGLREDIMVKEEMMRTYPDEIFPIQNQVKLELAKFYYQLGRIYKREKKNDIARKNFLKSIQNYKYSYKQFFYYFLSFAGLLARRDRE